MSTQSESVFIPQDAMKHQFKQILLKYGFADEKADTCAKVFMESSLDGVYTHGVNRFPRFVQYIKEGHVKVDHDPECVQQMGSIEKWDGRDGPGILNAIACTNRAMELAKKNGIGCVALRNTNHWMRGGTYGWHAATKGYVFLGWTNTIANMPPWGAKENKLGNNPLVIAIPHEQEAIVLDMAMSQFSFGSIEQAAMKKTKLSVPGGYDEEGNMTTDPDAVLNSRRIMPTGFWKGAGLSFVLDVLASMLSDGLSVHEISKVPVEAKLSQVFIAIDVQAASSDSDMKNKIHSIIDDYHHEDTRYPGERVLQTRINNTKNGIPVLKKVWDEIVKANEI